MIPDNISKEHIIKALKWIDRNGVPKERASTKFNLIFEEENYPPKYIISIANIFPIILNSIPTYLVVAKKLIII